MGRYDNGSRRKRSCCNDLSSRAAAQGAGGGARTAIPPCRGRVSRAGLWPFPIVCATAVLAPFFTAFAKEGYLRRRDVVPGSAEGVVPRDTPHRSKRWATVNDPRCGSGRCAPVGRLAPRVLPQRLLPVAEDWGVCARSRPGMARAGESGTLSPIVEPSHTGASGRRWKKAGWQGRHGRSSFRASSASSDISCAQRPSVGEQRQPGDAPCGQY